MQKHGARIKTGLILGILTIVIIFFAPNSLFFIICGIAISAAFWEFLNLISVRVLFHKIIYLLFFWACAAVMHHHENITLNIALIWWIIAFVMIFIPVKRLKLFKHKSVQFFVGLLMLAPAWIAFVDIHHHNRAMVFYLIMLVCFADTGAYFVGSAFGKHKLLPQVSPKKSIEGLIAALIIGNIAGLSVVLFLPHLTGLHFLYWLILGTGLILISVLGDLFESLLKRLYDTKDSGSLLPGHGGLLDRLDSLCAAAPIYALICHLTHLI
ncbi:MAG: phosphatidate cytidylyltransferase [Gammaproteobacteria bacterium]|nr:phosphatidate cytidylyltransferase [Gammaproteobacteria bacterium]